MLHIAYVGEDIDAAKDVATWAATEARERGLREEPGASGAPAPLVELFIYAGRGMEDLAGIIALACEGVWAATAFAGMAHVVPERHNALLGADVVVDALGLTLSDDTSRSIADEQRTLPLDMAFLAPDAQLITLTAGESVTETLNARRAD